MRKRILRSFLATVAMVFLVATGAFAAMGDVQNLNFNGFGPSDRVGTGERSEPDGRPDARFTASISGAGALSGLLLRADDGNATWDTTPGNGIWGMEVRDSSGKLLTDSSGRLPMVPFLGGMGIELFVADNGEIARGGRFTLTARFLDNSESSASVVVQRSITATPTRISLRSASWEGTGPRDETGRNETLRGDGNPDDRIRLQLEGSGTLVSVEVRNIVNGNPTAAWDTIPGNGRWALVVAEGNRMLNRSDGSVEVDLSGRTVLDLWMTDNGVISRGGNRFETVLRFSDGHILRGIIDEGTAEPTPTQSRGLDAMFAGEGERDLVGRNEERSGNGRRDWRVDVNLERSGTITGMKVANVRGPAGEWDTLPGNGKWLLGVTQTDGEVLNRSNGSIRFAVPRSGELILWLENNGSLGKSETRSVLAVTYDDGRVLEQEIQPYSGTSDTGAGDLIEATLAGTGNRDYVGKNETLRGNGSRDARFDIRFNGTGTLTGIRIVNTTKGGEWDTTPNNRRWLVAATRPNGEVLNESNGSIRLRVQGTTSLQLWVEDNGTLDNPDSTFRITLAFRDGETLETNIENRPGTTGWQGGNRDLELGRPWQASSDYVGPYDRLQRNGKGDWVFPLKIQGKGTVRSMSLRNIGATGIWDTVPGNGRWTLAVRGPNNRLLNHSNGSVNFSVPPNHNLHLFVENNGTLHRAGSRYELVVTWSDGSTSTVRIQ